MPVACQSRDDRAGVEPARIDSRRGKIAVFLFLPVGNQRERE